MNCTLPGSSMSLRFPRQEYWNGLQFPSPGNLPKPGIEPVSPALAGGFSTAESQQCCLPIALVYQTIWQCSGKSWEMLGLKLWLNPVRSIDLCHAIAIYINLCIYICVYVSIYIFIYIVLFHDYVVPNSLQPHEIQYTRLPHPSPTLWREIL